MVSIKKQTKPVMMSILVMLAGLLISLTSYASTYATVSKNKVTKNELFRLQIITDKKASSDDLNLDSLRKDFYVDRPSFGTSVNIINGDRSVRSQWDVSIAATRSGIITIPSFTVGNEKTQPIAIQVGNDPTLPGDDEIVEIHSTLGKSTLYPNESTLLHVRLMLKADTRHMQNPQIQPPSAQGVTLEAASQPDQHREIINGLAVTVLEQSFRITATKAGDFSVTEPVFTGTMLFNGMRGQTKVHAIKTTPKVFPVTVLPKPENYQGVWLPTSSLSLKQSWVDGKGKPISSASAAMKVGDSLTRTIQLQVSGLGQERIPDIQISYPDSLRVYKEKPDYKTLDNGDTLMTLKQVLIPNQAGHIEIPGISLNWWDSVNKKQKKSMLTGLNLDVAPGKPVETMMSVPQAPAAPATAPPAKEIKVKDAGYWPYLAAGFALLWLVTFILLVVVYRERSNTPKATAENTETKKAEHSSLKQAIKQKDGIRIQQLVNQHLTQFPGEENLHEEIQHEVNRLQSVIYSSAQDDYDPKPLMKLLAQLEKQAKKSGKKQTETLPQL
ncbi:BatD family protein [Vibrio quintilis]|uniref:Protein BatD n=1 Tax=Vibrio quintilis TaxID=1117707 RepID=A0A1M7YPR7_9VIBR|nr:BatD family protein [Vibrio quintilis]SHO54619.1 hypothetical protein VQ7734_00333 [Vibrio quintilis]